MVPGGDGLLLKAAKEIAADRAADLLVPLSVLAELAAGANRRTHDSPTRRDTREELQAISCGALDLADRLANPRLILFRRPLWDDVKPGRLRALAQTADWLLEVVHSGGGTSTLMDSLGAARDLLLIAVGVSLLFESVTGKWPGKTSGRAIETCSFIAQAAGIRTAAQDKLGGWERHLKAAGRLKNSSHSVPDNVWSARLEVVAAWQQAGVWGDAIAPVAAD